jgi:TRAP-type C4-dicarboxylate transport system permease small subunit
VAGVIKMVLGTLVMVFLVLIIYGGFRWMLSGGNEETITKAKKVISAALIGLVVILFSYVITAFVFNLILKN